MILDLGASRAALGMFSGVKGRLRLDEFAVEALPGPAGGEADWLEQTRMTLGVLRTRTKTKGPVVLVPPPHLTLTKLIKLPRVEPAKQRKVLRFEAEQGIPFAPNEVVWDTVVAAEDETETEMLLAAARREVMTALCAAVRAAGFEPRLVLPSSLATLAAFRLEPGARPGPVIVLNLGARSTTLLQVTDRRFAARSLALGTRNVIWKTAEQTDHVALEIIATRLAQEITRSVYYFRRQGMAENPVRICLAGGGARLPGLGEALAARLKVPVEGLNLSGSIEIGRGPVPPDVLGPILVFADLIGAAATQLCPGQPMLNLLPPAPPGHTKRRRRWLAAVTLVAAAACWMLVAHSRPVAAPMQVAAVIRHEPAVTPPVEAAPPPSVASEATEPSFDRELPEVKPASFPLQLAGYLGEAGDYQVIFTSTGQPGTLLARRGHRFESLGLTLKDFAVRKVAVDHADAWPVYEVAAFAVLHDEKTGAEVVLDSRHNQPTEPQDASVPHGR
ncbi:MAG TPA: pilus assembly protein PilM [Lacunisphaera sp.]